MCETVLTEIVELYLKVRLFAFVDRTMERYKRTTKEQIQKSKSLRTKLQILRLCIRNAPIIRKNNIKITVSVVTQPLSYPFHLPMVGVSIIVMLTYAREADSAICLSKDSVVFDVWMIMDQSTLHVRLQHSLMVNDPQPPLVTGVTAGLVPQTR